MMEEFIAQSLNLLNIASIYQYTSKGPAKFISGSSQKKRNPWNSVCEDISSLES